MERIRKNKDLPIWRKISPGTLVLRKPDTLRIKPKQKVQCAVEDLGRFAKSDFEVIDAGKGEFKVTKSIIKESVKKAEEALIRKGKTTHRKVVKEKDRVGFDQQGIKVDKKSSKKIEGDEKYTLNHKGAGKYEILSSNGKRMNTDLLKKKEAKALIKQLES